MQTLGNFTPKKQHVNIVKAQFLYYLYDYHKKKLATPLNFLMRDALMLHVH